MEANRLMPEIMVGHNSISLENSRSIDSYWNHVNVFSLQLNELLNDPIAGQRFIKDAGHKSVYSWTVNQEEQMNKLRELGIRGVITDDIDKCLNIYNYN